MSSPADDTADTARDVDSWNAPEALSGFTGGGPMEGAPAVDEAYMAGA